MLLGIMDNWILSSSCFMVLILFGLTIKYKVNFLIKSTIHRIAFFSPNDTVNFTSKFYDWP